MYHTQTHEIQTDPLHIKQLFAFINVLHTSVDKLLMTFLYLQTKFPLINAVCTVSNITLHMKSQKGINYLNKSKLQRFTKTGVAPVNMIRISCVTHRCPFELNSTGSLRQAACCRLRRGVTPQGQCVSVEKHLPL